MSARIAGAALETLRAVVAPLDTPQNRERYRRRDIPRGDAVRDIDTRYRFDLLYASRAYRLLSDDTLTDAHYLTALRAIVPALEPTEESER